MTSGSIFSVTGLPTYGSRAVELGQSRAVVIVNTEDSSTTILKYYIKLPEIVMRRSVESKALIPNAKV